MKYATFNRFELPLPEAAVADCHHQGECFPDVEAWEPRIDFSGISADAIRAELKEYGAWDKEQLADDLANRQRILWLAAGNIQEEELAA